jgi:hypothetical protein
MDHQNADHKPAMSENPWFHRYLSSILKYRMTLPVSEHWPDVLYALWGIPSAKATDSKLLSL